MTNASAKNIKDNDIGNKDAALQQFVSARVISLQRGYLRDNADAVAAMARLRRGIGAPVGSRPDIWAETLQDLPEALSDIDAMTRTERDGTPTAWEQAAHDAITLHAWHQQSRSEPMHRYGATFGGAIRVLGDRTQAVEAVRRRFHMAATATQYDLRLIQIRALITQLRSNAIVVDYGRLARDLRRLQNRRDSQRVLLDWGREYHRHQPENESNEGAATPSTPTEESERQ